MGINKVNGVKTIFDKISSGLSKILPFKMTRGEGLSKTAVNYSMPRLEGESDDSLRKRLIKKIEEYNASL